MSFADILGGAGSAVGGLVNLFSDSGEEGDARIQEILNLYRGLSAPPLSDIPIQAPRVNYLGDAQVAQSQAVLPQAPTLVEESPARALQSQALASLGAIPQDALSDIQARSLSEDILRGESRMQDSIRSRLAERGALGAGQETQARILGQRGSKDVRSRAAADIALGDLSRRASLADMQGTAAGRMRAQDFARSATNSEMAQNFNNMVASLGTANNQFNAGMQNRANLRNADTRQNISAGNQMARFNTDALNKDSLNRNALARSDFDFRRIGGQSQALGLQAQRADDRDSARQEQISNLFTGIGQTAGAGFDLASPAPKPKKGNSFNFSLFGF